MLNSKDNRDSRWPVKGTCISLGKICSWGTYLARCDIARRLLESKAKHDFRLSTWYKYWFPYYASLYIVIEGWNDIGFRDTRIDALLKSRPETLRKLRRLRNVVFHYQKSIMDDRIIDFFKSPRNIEWTYFLNDQFNRFFYEIFYKDIPGQLSHKKQIKKQIRSIIGWYPKPIDDTLEEFMVVFNRFKKLARKNDELSEKAKDVALSAANGIRIARRAKKKINNFVDNLCAEPESVDAKIDK